MEEIFFATFLSSTETNCYHLASNLEMTTMTVRVAFVVALVGSMAAQGVEVPADTVIRLQRTACLGQCPIYAVTIDARGMVTYDGGRFVRVVGRQTAKIPVSVVATLLASAERIRFFEMRDAYRAIENSNGTFTAADDLPTTIVTVTVRWRRQSLAQPLGRSAQVADVVMVDRQEFTQGFLDVIDDAPCAP